ncbi:hypothetical protein [Paenibacillus sp. YN15]|uniref:hypothetical protein n=1 Tax=Paenibacillus sp. YN15 TaxID=1742774 RepID=UPI000DCE684F|nr:hypothetical protein [Paenibacillus sp. YN15]RAU92813.1 hypothetical protein DQG13_26720 [Paenibacillus sp. YN15]
MPVQKPPAIPAVAHTPLKAKPCYRHLGGALGERLFEGMLELGWLRPDEENPRHFCLTELGVEGFKELGVNPYEGKR